MNTYKLQEYFKLLLLTLLVLLSRLPFLNAGYGVEEDSWGIAVAAYHTQLYGIMEASRLPGHPVNEFIYSIFWGYGPWIFNFFSAICSIICFVFFYFTAKKLEIKHSIWAALALVFTPVVYINSTCTIDYLWALMFVIISFYALVNKNLVLSAVFLALAVGCRINSAVLYIPFLCWIYFDNNRQLSIKQFLVFSIVFGVVILLCFIPIISVYGWQFFSYSDQFPYPNWAKIIYKATIGVIGLPALFMLFVLLSKKIFKQGKISFKINAINTLFFSLLILQIWAYLMLPQKSAYLMLLVPFGLLWLAHFLDPKSFLWLCISVIFSSFFMSINLTDSYRGAQYSKLAIKSTIAGQEIFLDPLTGPVINDYTKRINKLNYTLQVIEAANKIKYPTIIICGWWFNQILIQQMDLTKQGMVKYAFYLNPSVMENYRLKGYTIYYLSEQEAYNDLFYHFNSTKEMANPFFLANVN
jgi:hypothetical protein